MKNGERLSLEQIRTFLAASEEFRFEANNREEIYGWVTRTLVEQEYGGQKREAKGLFEELPGEDDRSEPGASDAVDWAVFRERDSEGAKVWA
jgi:hypothetical protein